MLVPSLRLRVLARPAFSNIAQNPYNATVYRNIAEYGLDIYEYSRLNALRRRHHVVHVHWPESIFNSRCLGIALSTTEELLWMLHWQRLRGARVMWTVHNLRAHDSPHQRFEERFWNRYTQLVDGFIALREDTLGAIFERFPILRQRPYWIIRHPHYRGQYPDDTDRKAARTRLGLASNAHTILFFGRVRPYKNVISLLRAFKSLRDQEDRVFRLIVAGDPVDRISADALEREAESDPRIELVFRFIEPEESQYYFRASDLVVLPYREILNSGSALLALSFDRPVLLPRSGCEADLAKAVPRPWVLNYNELTSTVLDSALLLVGGLPERSDGAHLAPFVPSRISAATATAYRELVTTSPSDLA